MVRLFFQLTALISFFLGLTLQIDYRRLSPVLNAAARTIAGALAGVTVTVGTLSGLLHWRRGNRRLAALGAVGAALSAYYIHQLSDHGDPLQAAFGRDWKKRIHPEQARHFYRWRRWNWPIERGPRLLRDHEYAHVDGRALLCDLWLPPERVAPSGLAVIFLHGGGWHFNDKDIGTGMLFNHLARQGHIVMDLAYRMLPETDLDGMIGDVYRAQAWLTKHSARFGVNPDRIVLAGASAGAHLALMAAYTSAEPDYRPPELRGTDLPVRAVVVYYPPADLLALHRHGQHILGRGLNPVDRVLLNVVNAITLVLTRSRFDFSALQPFSKATPAVIQKMLHDNFENGIQMDSPLDLLTHLLGGTPVDCPERYRQASPVTHVGAHCPPTLILHGTLDTQVPPESSRALYTCLANAGVPAVLIEYPRAEHAFDVFLPWIAPAAHNAAYDIERFLALMM
jgi:acetyl esterase/lipase